MNPTPIHALSGLPGLKRFCVFSRSSRGFSDMAAAAQAIPRMDPMTLPAAIPIAASI